MDDLTGSQIRMARAHLRWSIEDLAKKSGVGASTIKRAEAAEGAPPVNKPNIRAIRAAFEDAGIEFIAENGGGAGLRLRTPGAA